MRSSVSVIVIALMGAMASCSPKVTSNIVHKFPPQESVGDVILLNEKDQLPADADWMGGIEVKGKANYDKMAEMTRFKAWESGGNYVKVKSFGSDGVRSDIRLMRSDVYRADTAKVNPNDIRTVERPATAYIVSGANGTTESVVQTNETVEPSSFDKLDNVRVYAGYGRRLNKIAPELNVFEKEHIKRLMNGIVFGAEYIQYFKKARGAGLGLRYQIMHATSSDPATITYENGSTKDGVLNETVNISFIGPVYSGRMASQDNKHLFVANVGMGALLWNDIQKFDKESLTVTGRTMGSTFDINYSYFLSDHVTLGAGISYTTGVIRKATYSSGEQTRTVELEENQYEGLVHMGICAQLIYTF